MPAVQKAGDVFQVDPETRKEAVLLPASPRNSSKMQQ